MESDEDAAAASKASAWKRRHENLQARAFSSHQREIASNGREEAAAVRAQAAGIRASAAEVRDAGARTRDDASRTRDAAAIVRDQAARARDLANQTRAEATRRRLLKTAASDRAAWQEILELDRVAASHGHDAATRDREAANLDRTAAEKDRDAAERDRDAAAKDRQAADKDREAADRDRQAAEADRAAADSDRSETEDDLELAEERLTKAERLAAMGRLAASIGHELHNPLAALTLTLSSLGQELTGAPNAAALGPLVADAQEAVQHIARVLADMKTWLHGSERVTRGPVDLAALVNDSLHITRTRLEQVATVVVSLGETPPAWGVSTRLIQVLTNLLLNAAQAITGAREHNEIRVTSSVAGTSVLLEVHDTGAGISEAVLPHIFDPFFTTREGRGGTGLGLFLCERIITEHGGALTVETRPGAGTTFRLELPTQATTAAASPSVARHRPRVLIIDDEPSFVRSMKRVLAATCDVTAAAGGAEGLALLLDESKQFDLVLCDLMMPEVNGIEVYRRLQAVNPARAAELVFVSGGATTQESASFLAGLPNLQLEKPFSPAALHELIARRMEGLTTSSRTPT